MTRFGSALVSFVAAAFILSCSDGGIVGGRCRDGLVACAGHCIDPSSAENVCGASMAGSGGLGSGATAGAAGSASGGGGMAGRGGAGAAGAGGAGGLTGTSGMAGQAGHSGVSCDGPRVGCSGQCVDLNVDAENCGRCNHVCSSGLCQGGQCVGANVGHIVLACMDFTQVTTNAAQSMLLGNAVFIPLKSTVRILAYAEHASARARTHVDDTIQSAAEVRGRTFQITAVSSEVEVRTNLSILDYDVLLVYDQPAAPAGELAQTGLLWAETLDAFVRSGGVVVALDGGDGASEMHELIQNAALLDTSAAPDATFQTLYNRAPADGVGLNVISPYFALRNTCTFQTTVTPDLETVFVVTDRPASAGLGDPVVVHRIRAP
jgi:hypothetical protein